jgi:hypothetical protein
MQIVCMRIRNWFLVICPIRTLLIMIQLCEWMISQSKYTCQNEHVLPQRGTYCLHQFLTGIGVHILLYGVQKLFHCIFDILGKSWSHSWKRRIFKVRIKDPCYDHSDSRLGYSRRCGCCNWCICSTYHKASEE